MWPLAALDMVRGAQDATMWSRLHARQALVFGLLASTAYVLLLALPLAVMIAVPGISTGATVIVYGLGMLADIIVAVVLLGIALTYYGKAARGELFAIPLVTPLVDRFMPLERR